MTVSVIGEAGLGKTRLVQESARRLDHEVTILTGRCLPYGEGLTFFPLREVVRQAAGGDDSPQRIKDLLAGSTGAAGVAERLHRAFGPGDQGRWDASEIFWAARRFLEALARPRPLLVVFEDLHWAEPTFSIWWSRWLSSPGRHRSPWSASPVPSCWNCVPPGRPRRTGRYPSCSRPSARSRPLSCSTR